MTRVLVAYGATLIAFCICDFVWLGLVAKAYYQSQIGGLLLAQPNWTAAMIFYPLYTVGIVYFAVVPAPDAQAWTKAMLQGAFLGAIAYGTYDLSNLATLKGWSTRMTLVDIAWGVIVSGVAATAGYLAAARVGAVA